jgi:hypothetical protein
MWVFHHVVPHQMVFHLLGWARIIGEVELWADLTAIAADVLSLQIAQGPKLDKGAADRAVAVRAVPHEPLTVELEPWPVAQRPGEDALSLPRKARVTDRRVGNRGEVTVCTP